MSDEDINTDSHVATEGQEVGLLPPPDDIDAALQDMDLTLDFTGLPPAPDPLPSDEFIGGGSSTDPVTPTSAPPKPRKPSVDYRYGVELIWFSQRCQRENIVYSGGRIPNHNAA